MNNFISCFLSVGGQVLVLFLLLAVGFICNKIKLLTKEANRCLSSLIVSIVTPCMIVRSFSNMTFSSAELLKLGLAFLVAFCLHFLMIGLSCVVIRDPDERRRRVLRFATVFTNAGFVALPLQEALLGAEGTFVGAAYVAVFNILIWSYGVVAMSGDKKLVSAKKVLISPGIISIFIGLIIFVFPIKLPAFLGDTVGHLANMNVPLPMIVVGYYLGDSDLLGALKDLSSYKCLLYRLIVFPLVGLGLMYLCNIRGTMLIASVISIASPVGTLTAIMADRFNADTDIAVRLVSLSTLFSMVTMPFVVGLAMMVA